MTGYPVIVLTGGPGGGRTALIDELRRNPDWAGRFVALPEAISIMRYLDISPQEQFFQRVMVHLQIALEDGVQRAFSHVEPHIILCHRGSLDPLAYWLDRGWSKDAFFTFTVTHLEEHYRRYTAVLHLVTAADGASEHYTRWPETDRPEGPEDAVRLGRLLQRVWCDHPQYYRLDNEGKDWQAKSQAAHEILSELILNGSGLEND